MVFIGVFGQLVYFAQAFKIFTTKSVADLSLFGFTTGLIAVSSWLVYGLVLKDIPLIIANVVACIGALACVAGILIFR